MLVIDDEVEVGAMIAEVLSSRGYHVEHSAGGEGAIDRAVAGRFGLVISDYAIPGLNGLEFVRGFARQDPHGRVLMVSAYLDPEAEAALRDHPAVVGWVRKPFNILDLIARVDAHFAGRSAGGPRDFVDEDFEGLADG